MVRLSSFFVMTPQWVPLEKLLKGHEHHVFDVQAMRAGIGVDRVDVCRIDQSVTRTTLPYVLVFRWRGRPGVALDPHARQEEAATAGLVSLPPPLLPQIMASWLRHGAPRQQLGIALAGVSILARMLHGDAWGSHPLRPGLWFGGAPCQHGQAET